MQPTFADKHCYVSQSGRESRLVLSWSLAVPDGLRAADYDVFVWRGEVDTELSPIGGPLNAADYKTFVDYTGKLLDVHKQYVYELRLSRARNLSALAPAGVVATSGNLSWDGDRDVVAEFIIGEHNFQWRHVTGVPVAVFGRKQEANSRCPECWNPVLKRPQRSSCKACFGTGFVAGFYAPVYAWADLSSQVKLHQIAEWGVKQPSQYDLMFSDYPRMNPGDMVVELVSDNRWAVSQSRDMEKRRIPMIQMVRLDLINKSDIEYAVQVPEEWRERAVRELEAVKRNPRAY